MWFICYQTSIFLYLITVRNEVPKVMFLHVSVILFTGGVLSQHALQVVSQHALQQGGLLLGGCLFHGGSAPGGVCSWGGCLLGGGSAPGGVPAAGGSVEPPRKQTATVADGTHPTGMHSCLRMI